ncbi:GIY-YIG nuclease family protein [Prevotella sp. P6B4]|uniref:GIY-YIG nuclease family protein n=1 Tax=Prevotella sp. P6B4 TaxID=1410614 RepID=UPI0006842DBD|nr:GIY-YIG nuclease family protein [Prevotella sp. P6B4]
MFPSSTLFHFPILALLADGNVHTSKEIREYEIKSLSITAEQASEMTKGGEKSTPKNKLYIWTDRAISDLRSAAFLEHKGDGYVITEDGKAFLKKHKKGFKAGDLKESTPYRKYKRMGEFNRSKKSKTTKEVTTSIINETSKGPTKEQTFIEDGVVYILTNPAFKTFYIKIGYTTNIDDRLKELYNTSVPLPFSVYALLETKKYKQAEKMLHSAFKASRIGKDREFFMLNPEEALGQMKIVAEGLDAIVKVFDDEGKVKKVFDYSK